MKPIWLLTLLLPGGSLLVLTIWWRHRSLRRDQDALAAEFKLRGGHAYRFTGHDEELRKRTEDRRAIADRTRRRASKVESGASSGDVLREVKRA